MSASSNLLRLVDTADIDATHLPTTSASCIVEIVSVDSDGTIEVELEGSRLQAMCLEHVARSIVESPSESLGRQALVTFTDAERRCPVIIGLIGLIGLIGTGVRSSSAHAAGSTSNALQTRIDGRHVSIEAGEELTLRCGKASVTLSADGRVVVKGMEIVSRAMLSHKIKGGTVNIN